MGSLCGGGTTLLVGLVKINKQNLRVTGKVIQKQFWPRQTLSCVRSLDLLALLGEPSLLTAFIWKISSPHRRHLW